MEWFLKTPTWEFSELERDSGTNISSVVGRTNLSGTKSNGDCSVDLKLGRLGDLNDGMTNKWKNSQGTTSTSFSSSSTKRSRGTNTASQNVSCLVDGCNAELSSCREYHKRHKVCEVHAKTPIVMVGGQQQRFCQQCSRFHLLGEFDEIKRSCRKRLDGHNRRRRKPQPDAVSANSAGLYPPYHQGNRFSSYQHILTTSIPDPTWNVPVKSEADPIYSAGHHHLPLHFLDSHRLVSASSRDYKPTSSFPFGRASVKASTATTSPSLFNTISSADSDCALSLLSSSNRNSGISLAHMVPSNRIPMAQPLFTGLQYDSSNDNRTGHGSSNNAVSSCCPFLETSNGMSTFVYSHPRMENEQVETTIFVASGGEAVVPCQEMFNVSGEDAGPIDSETSLTLPIFWHS